MTTPGPLPSWEWLRPLDKLIALWWTPAMAPVSSSAAAAWRTTFLTLKQLVVGRRITLRLGDGQLTLTVTQLDSSLDVRSLAVGQLSDVRMSAREVGWNESRFGRASAVLHNLHLRPTATPMLVAAPVELSLEVPTPALDQLIRRAAPRFTGEVGLDGVARVWLARRPAMGHLEVDVQVDGSTLWLKPRRIALRRKRWALPARTPAYPVRLPELPHGLQLTEVTFAPGVMCLAGSVPQWRVSVSTKRLDDILGQLGAAGRTLNLSGIARLR